MQFLTNYHCKKLLRGATELGKRQNLSKTSVSADSNGMNLNSFVLAGNRQTYNFYLASTSKLKNVESSDVLWMQSIYSVVYNVQKNKTKLNLYQ